MIRCRVHERCPALAPDAGPKLTPELYAAYHLAEPYKVVASAKYHVTTASDQELQDFYKAVTLRRRKWEKSWISAINASTLGRQQPSNSRKLQYFAVITTKGKEPWDFSILQKTWALCVRNCKSRYAR